MHAKGIIVIHAGMPKTGSTSLQRWLAAERKRLLSRHGIRVVVAWPWRFGRGRTGVRLVPPSLGSAESNRLGKLVGRGDGQREAVADSLFEQLDQSADRASITVVSSEALAGRFTQADERFLAGLDELGGRRRVRVAYYVRPQDAALEAAWRQWGFRAGAPPSQFVRGRTQHYRHYRTLSIARELAPSVAFEPRPFRTDLLPHGSVVEDFARHFLDLDRGAQAPSTEEGWSNRGVPLQVVNALRGGEGHEFWASHHDNRRVRAVKRLAADLDIPETDAIRRSRLVLRAHANRTFEEENRRLIAALAWPTDAFVPPVEEELPEEELKLSRLDELWAPEASEAELALLRSAIVHASSVRGSLRLLLAQLRRDA